MSQKWEHLAVTVPMQTANPETEVVKELDEYGAHGWELCGFTTLMGVAPMGWVLFCVFKRLVDPETEKIRIKNLTEFWPQPTRRRLRRDFEEDREDL